MLFITLVSISSIYPQSKYEYYSVDQNTLDVIYQDGDTTKKMSLSANTVIKIKLVESNKIYFVITRNGGALAKDVLYYIAPSDFDDRYFSFRASFKGGLFTVPFKYRPDKSKIYPGGALAFSGSYKYSFSGITLHPLAFAGLTTVSVADVNVQNGSTETKVGFTCGLGLSIGIFDAFDLGIVAGWDFIEKTWESNGRVWYAVSFNYPFLE